MTVSPASCVSRHKSLCGASKFRDGSRRSDVLVAASEVFVSVCCDCQGSCLAEARFLQEGRFLRQSFPTSRPCRNLVPFNVFFPFRRHSETNCSCFQFLAASRRVLFPVSVCSFQREFLAPGYHPARLFKGLQGGLIQPSSRIRRHPSQAIAIFQSSCSLHSEAWRRQVGSARSYQAKSS